MALRLVATRPDPAILSLPWSLPLREWGDEYVVPLPLGWSRHVVRIVRVGGRAFAVKETWEQTALREHYALEDLRSLGAPAVRPHAVVNGRFDRTGAPLDTALVTEYLPLSLPYLSLFARGITPVEVPPLVDAMVVLLVRLHRAGFFWGDVSFSNVLFRRDAGALAAYLVDAESGELRHQLSDRMRKHDINVACQNIFGEVVRLQTREQGYRALEPEKLTTMLSERYAALWDELAAAAAHPTAKLSRIEKRVERLNLLGYDIDAVDLVTDFDGHRVEIRPKVVEPGHCRREFQTLTGITVEDDVARMLLNDIVIFTLRESLGREERPVIAARWLGEVFGPALEAVPPEARVGQDPAETFCAVVRHRRALGEQTGREIGTLAAARHYADAMSAATLS